MHAPGAWCSYRPGAGPIAQIFHPKERVTILGVLAQAVKEKNMKVNNVEMSTQASATVHALLQALKQMYMLNVQLNRHLSTYDTCQRVSEISM